MLEGNIFITGGTGSLGRALLRYLAEEEATDRVTVYSRDEIKQQALKREYPHVHCVIGDVADYDTLERAMVGHAVVLHLAAFKHIPAGESNVLSMLNSNLLGSQNVAQAALRNGVHHVLGISTDKAVHPVNAYGCSKMLMERVFQEFNAYGLTEFHLVRYGNVVDSTGSVLPLWKRQVERGEPITLTDRDMTRFWLSVEEAVHYALTALAAPAGTVYVPRLKGLSMERFAEYVMPQAEIRITGLRPGEKRHEELITLEESRFARKLPRGWVLYPNTSATLNAEEWYFDSRVAEELTRAELLELLEVPA